MRESVIVSAVRTPIGNFNGTLKEVPAVKLGSTVITEAICRAGLTGEDVDEVIMGCVLPTGMGQNPARQAMILAGLPMERAALTVNKVCGSGLMAVMCGDQAIRCGDADIIVAGGMENMNQAPFYLPGARTGYRMGNATMVDGMIHDGIWDVVNDFHMGYTAELISEKFGISRRDMDEFAVMSNERAMASIESGRFEKEIVPIAVPQRRGEPTLFSVDETPSRVTMDVLARLRPAFKKDGQVTAGNASKISDGAAAVVIVEKELARKRGLPILARVGAHGAAGMALEDVLITPMRSIPKVLGRAGLTSRDIDLFEINEAFAVSTVAISRELGIPHEKLNVHGGAVALGHPIGCSGARVLVTLLHAMQARDARRGMASLCLGGAEAVSMIVEREDA